MNMTVAFVGAVSDNILMQIMAKLTRHSFNMSYLLLIYTIQAILAINSRQHEFEADYFAYEIGYGENLLESLYILQETSMNRKMTLKEKLLASHPNLAKRIRTLEEVIDNEEIEIETPVLK